jgi:hercynine metabolism protein
MSPSWLEELEARLEEQLEDFLRANPRQEELLAEQDARDRQIRLRQERLELQQQAEAKRQRLMQLAQEIRLWQQRRDKASAAGAADLAIKAAAHLAVLMEQGREDWQSLTDLGQRFASVEAALDALNTPSEPARAAGAGATRATSGPTPPASATPKGSGRANPTTAEPRRSSSQAGAAPAAATAAAAATANSTDHAANTTDHTAKTNAETSRRQPGTDTPAAATGAASQARDRVDPAVDLEAAWHAFATQQELEELRRRVGS